MSRSLRVLLISANTEQLPDPVFPLGAAYMAAVAERAGHEVDSIDLCFLDDRPEQVAEKIRVFAPDVIGISLRNLDSSSYPENTSYIDDYRSLVEAVRNQSDAFIVLGGAGFTVMPATIMQVLPADAGVVGEGEHAFPWILTRVADRVALETTPEVLCEPAGQGVLVTPVTRIKQLDVTGAPMRQRFDMDLYYERGGALNIQTKRGCMFECVFCSYPLIEGSKVRMRTAEIVVDEIQQMREEFGVRHLFFVDNIFNLPMRHAKNICEEIIRRELDVEWSGYLNPKFIDEELCQLMARSGCKAIEFGTDAGSATMIESLKKEFDIGDLRRTSKLCHDHNLKFCHSLIFGGPGENKQTVNETLQLMDELQPTAVIAMTGIRILPGTGMVDLAIQDGQIDETDNLLYPRFYISPGLKGEMIEQIEGHAKTHPNWIVPGKSIRTNVAVLRKLRERKVKGQLWRLLRPAKGTGAAARP
ncbi:MAG: lipid biosynthesis B12-binding/radical SAM protein [Candidatus Binatia bacterium]|nr:lipid biosynthesis B12-binding/radical SAM protein [Candidatus Binatia bacterium]